MIRLKAVLVGGLLLLAPALSAQEAQVRLWDGAMAGDTATLAAALRDGAVVDSLDVRRSPNGRRALNWAAIYNRVDAIRYLLAHGAALDATNLTGFTPLHHAAEQGSVDAARVLLDAGADPEHRNEADLRPIDTARAKGHVALVSLLEGAARKQP